MPLALFLSACVSHQSTHGNARIFSFSFIHHSRKLLTGNQIFFPFPNRATTTTKSQLNFLHGHRRECFLVWWSHLSFSSSSECSASFPSILDTWSKSPKYRVHYLLLSKLAKYQLSTPSMAVSLPHWNEKNIVSIQRMAIKQLPNYQKWTVKIQFHPDWAKLKIFLAGISLIGYHYSHPLRRTTD